LESLGALQYEPREVQARTTVPVSAHNKHVYLGEWKEVKGHHGCATLTPNENAARFSLYSPHPIVR
jgi:hypothetical protein